MRGILVNSPETRISMVAPGRISTKTGLGSEFWELEREILYLLLSELLIDVAFLGVADGAAYLAAGSVDISVVNSTVAAWAKIHAGELVRGIVDNTRRDLADGIARWIDTNGSLPELIEWVQTSFDFGEGRGRMIAVTEVTRAYAHGNIEAWKNSGAVKGKRWLTANDDLVCEFCGPLNGMKVGLHDAFVNEETGTQYNSPPAHPNCRCAVYPVVIMPESDESGE